MVKLHAQQTPTPGAPAAQGISEKFDSLIIIDRRVDMVTPMLTQLTYEGIIDEFVGVSNSKALTSHFNCFSLILIRPTHF
jgi:hypothetical protein